jgi:hypothetical protein
MFEFGKYGVLQTLITDGCMDKIKKFSACGKVIIQGVS